MQNAFGLVVGIANYQHIGKLPPAVLADARDVNEVLTDLNRCAYLPEHVELLLDGEATQAGLLNALDKLARRANDDSTVFFYLSGHGGRTTSGRFVGEYLLPVDTLYDSVESLARTAISGTQFTEMLLSIPARKVVVVFDTCHSGGIGEPKGLRRPEFEPLPESFYVTLAAGHGRVIIASSLSSERSFILPGAANSLFTQHMLAGLRGGVPGPGGIIRIFDLYDYVQPRVTKDCPHQHPFFKAAVRENFPIALYLGGKGVDATVYGTVVNPHGASPGKVGRIMRQLDLLVGTDQKLLEHDRGVLSAALLSVTGNSTQQKSTEARSATAPAVDDEVKEVVERAHPESETIRQPYRYPRSELLSALLRIGLRLDLRRHGMSSSELATDHCWTLDNWLSYLTEEIVCERGLLRFHLLAPSERWVRPLTGATAVAMEGLWQELRSVLTRNELSFAVARSRFEIDRSISKTPRRVLKLISEAAEKAVAAWPKFPHFGDRLDLAAVEELIPLPESIIRSPVVFRGRTGCPARLTVNKAVAPESCGEEGGKIEYWPQTEGPVDCLLECDEGGGFVPLVRSRLQRLYSVETVVFDTAPDRLDACRRLGLKNEVLQILWPRIIVGEAEPTELATALHILRDAWGAYEELSVKDPSLLDRHDAYWDAMEIIRKQMTKEK